MMTNNDQAKGARYRQAREAKGWTMAMLYAKSGVSPSVISILERGGPVRVQLDQKIRRALGLQFPESQP
jgi:transcriptional regulator with XRE-family HTH domain